MPRARQQMPVPVPPGGYSDLRLWARSWLLQHPVAGIEPEDVALASTELVSTSVRHGSGPVDLEHVEAEQELRLNVSDCSSAVPKQRAAGPASMGGRGLTVLVGTSSSWGVSPRPQRRKTVWCELNASPRTQLT